MSEASIARFAEKVNEIMPVISREFLKQTSGDFYKLKITLPQYLILSFLDKEGESRMTDLAGFVHVTTAAMTGIIGRLVRDGYAVRKNDPADRRIVNVKLTQKGKHLVDKVTGERRKAIMNIFGKISAREREHYLRILMHIKESLT